MSSTDIHLPVLERHRTEVSEEFLRGMINRMAMSFEKYGAVSEAYPDKFNALASMEKRLALYAETGNSEALIDAANFLMIEFMRPRHAAAHFHAQDSSSSPGRIDASGRQTQRANTDHREHVRTGGDALGMRTTGGAYRREGD